MMIILLIIGIVGFTLGVIALISEEKDLAFLFGVISTWLMAIAIVTIQEHSKPSAMDVYKGKTTLEITYKDGVPVDSVVVFKYKNE